MKNKYALVAFLIFPKSILKNNADTPKINIRLATFDPITFPIMASVTGISFNDATMVMTNSGADVPKATIVRPIKIGERENSFAIMSANKIMRSAQ